MPVAKIGNDLLPTTRTEPFDARTAKPEEVDARLAELTRSTSRRELEYRKLAGDDARVLADLRAGR